MDAHSFLICHGNAGCCYPTGMRGSWNSATAVSRMASAAAVSSLESCLRATSNGGEASCWTHMLQCKQAPHHLFFSFSPIARLPFGLGP